MRDDEVALFTYAGTQIPIRPADKAVNISILCGAEKKRAFNILNTKDARNFIERVSVTTGIAVVKLVYTVEGRYGGTWAHPEVAIYVASKLSQTAHDWMIKRIAALGEAGVMVELAERDEKIASQTLEIIPVIKQAVGEKFEELKQAELPRERVKAEIKRILFEVAARFYGNECPCPAPVHGGKLTIDHMHARGASALKALWTICEKCQSWKNGNQANPFRQLIQAAFDAFQVHVEEHIAPLLFPITPSSKPMVPVEAQLESTSPALMARKIVVGEQSFWCPRDGTDLTDHRSCPHCGWTEDAGC